MTTFSTATMSVNIFVLLSICGTIKFSTSENWQEIDTNLHTHIQRYSGNINATEAFSSSLNECISGCFAVENASFLYHKESQLCQCHPNQFDFDESTVETSQLYGYYLHGYRTFKLESFKKWHIFPKQRDCLALYKNGFVEDGVYLIYPVIGIGVTTWCDMTNGGWTVIQRRLDGQEDFYRTWDEYVTGFGNETGEYWLGLESIHLLTQSPSSLYIEMESFGDITPTSAYAVYSSFTIAGGTSNYTMFVDGFTGNCGDSLIYHNGKQFTTIDRDNDDYHLNCAVLFSGAWWHNTCHTSNLNGLYFPEGNHSSFAKGINWYSCWGHDYSLKSTVMKIRQLA